MINFFYNRRFTVFLVSFLVMLFGDIFIPANFRVQGETVLLVQNMAFSTLLFLHRPKKEKVIIVLIIMIGVITRFSQDYMQSNAPFVFAIIYFFYFAFISYRLFMDLSKQKTVGLETIAAVFCGFILLGVMASIAFASLHLTFGGFEGVDGNTKFYDFVYFSFITLMTIGYGDITPTLEISKKAVVAVSLLGHFYTVFVTAIIVGKYLGGSKNSSQ